MAQEITLNSRITDDNDNEIWGVLDDTRIYRFWPNRNYGTSRFVFVSGISDQESYVFLRLKMPKAPENADKITSIRLYLNLTNSSGSGSRVWALFDAIVDKLPFGSSDNAEDRRGCSWNERMAGLAWKDSDTRKAHNPNTGHDTALATFDLLDGVYDQSWIYFELTRDSGLDWDVEKLTCLRHAENTAISDGISSREDAISEELRPYLEVKYLMKQPEIPENEEAFLTAKPNPANPEQVLLKWKRPKNKDLKVKDGVNEGAYVLVRHTSPIQDYDTGTLIARLSSELEYVDDLSGQGNDGIPYYYRILICSESSYIEGDGTGGAMSTYDEVGVPLLSNEVVIEKPKVTSFVCDDYSQTVWDKQTYTTICQTPATNNLQNVAYQHDWLGDGSERGWIELETPSDSQAQVYGYSSYLGGSVTPKVRVRNGLGYWSAQYSLASAVILGLLAPLAEVRIAPKEVLTFEGCRIRGDESLDRHGDGEITKFEFQIQHTFGVGLRYWNGTTWVAGVQWVNITDLTPYYDLAGTATTEEGNYYCYVRITGLGGSLQVSVAETLVVISVSAIEIRGGLSDSAILSMVGSGRRTLTTKKTKLEGTESIRIVEGVESEERNIEGVSRRDDFVDDVLQLLAWQESQQLLKYFYDEPENVKYILFRIDNVRERRRGPRRITWSLEISVEGKTLS